MITLDDIIERHAFFIQNWIPLENGTLSERIARKLFQVGTMETSCESEADRWMRDKQWDQSKGLSSEQVLHKKKHLVRTLSFDVSTLPRMIPSRRHSIHCTHSTRSMSKKFSTSLLHPIPHIRHSFSQGTPKSIRAMPYHRIVTSLHEPLYYRRRKNNNNNNGRHTQRLLDSPSS